MRTNRGLAVVWCCVVGCGAEGPELVAGFSPPAPAAGEVQYVSPIIRDIQPGEERIVCSYLDAYVDDDLDLSRIAGFSTAAGHHIVMYATTLVQQPNTHDCKEEEMIFFSMVGSAERGLYSEEKVPDGLVRRLKSGSQLVFQSHWLNTSDEVVDGQAAFNVRLAPISPTKTPTDFMAVMNTSFAVTPGDSTASVECTFADSVTIWQLAGHQHDLGKHIRIAYTPRGGREHVLIDEDWNRQWSYNAQFVDFTAAPMIVNRGDTLRVDCDWSNPGLETIRFPGEMCGAVAQFFPSKDRLVCLNGDWLRE
jgi:hypothetical protein